MPFKITIYKALFLLVFTLLES